MSPKKVVRIGSGPALTRTWETDLVRFEWYRTPQDSQGIAEILASVGPAPTNR
jgi:hypothetical protein